MNLRYHYDVAFHEGEGKHAIEKIDELGIKYIYSVPQSLGEQYWFLCCENVPENLPMYITKMEISDANELIGYGLNKEMAETVNKYKDK